MPPNLDPTALRSLARAAIQMVGRESDEGDRCRQCGRMFATRADWDGDRFSAEADTAFGRGEHLCWNKGTECDVENPDGSVEVRLARAALELLEENERLRGWVDWIYTVAREHEQWGFERKRDGKPPLDDGGSGWGRFVGYHAAALRGEPHPRARPGEEREGE